MPGSRFIISSNVVGGDKVFLVSTIERESSASLAYGARYNETLVYDAPRGGDLVFQAEDSTGSIRRHFEICDQIIEKGVPGSDPEDSDE